jgi:hypothetical protein
MEDAANGALIVPNHPWILPGRGYRWPAVTGVMDQSLTSIDEE